MPHPDAPALPLPPVALCGADTVARDGIAGWLQQRGHRIDPAAALRIAVGDAQGAAVDLQFGGRPVATHPCLGLPLDLALAGTMLDLCVRLHRERQARERAERSRDRFVSLLSHDLRTPLNAILGWAELLQGASADRDREQGLAAIARNARAQAQLIGDVVDVIRLEAGTLELQAEAIDPRALADAVRVAALPAAEARQQRLESTVAAGTPPFLTDPARLQQALLHLLGNAIRFSPRQSELRLRIDGDGPQLVIQVSDPGRGLDADRLDQLNRLDDAELDTTRPELGLGLGLRYVREIARRHDGRIRYQSAGLATGTTVTLRLAPLRG